MGEKDAKVWHRLAAASEPEENDRQCALALYRQFMERNVLPAAPSVMLGLKNSVIFSFYSRLALFTTPGRPFYRKQSVQWFTARSLYKISLPACGGWEGLLKILPLLKNSSLIISHFLPEDSEGKVVSHARTSGVFHSETAEKAGVGQDAFILLVLEAMFRLNIGVIFEIGLEVSPDALVILKRPELFKASPAGFLFDIDKEATRQYLAAVVGHWQQHYRIDGIFFNFSALSWPLKADISKALYSMVKTRPSFGVAAVNVDAAFCDILLSPQSSRLRLENLPAVQRQLWRYISNSFGLFTYCDAVGAEDFPLYMESRLIKKEELAKAEVLGDVNGEAFSLIVSRYKNCLFVILFTHDAVSESFLNLTDYYANFGFYTKESDFFYAGSYTLEGSELCADKKLLLPALPAGTAVSYRLTF
jgi:hypothetical protein